MLPLVRNHEVFFSVRNRNGWILRTATACMLAGGCPILVAAQQPTVKTAQGEAAGKWILQGTQKAFLGLPYAAPPTSELRWKAPQPASPWKGVRDATRFGARCEQWHVWNDYIFLDEGPSEDCLYLNVYTPASATAANKLPVMVWIHGGGFIAGAGSEPRYTNSALVPKGVILVTLNYRLGLFGLFGQRGPCEGEGWTRGELRPHGYDCGIAMGKGEHQIVRWGCRQRNHLRGKRGIIRSQCFDDGSRRTRALS